jgi:bacterial surface proteins containing Ig-like domains
MAVVMAFSLAGIAPNTSSEAAAKKPTLTKKVTVTVGKKKTVKVTSKKKVKKTTWSLNKKGKKVVSLSKKKAKSVVVKGKKAGKATLTAKIKVGKKTYKKTCKITVKKASKVNVTPVPAKTDAAKATATPANNNNNNGGSTATATPKPTEAPVSVIKTEAGTYTVDESATYNVPLTELNETTFTCDAKRSDGETVKDGTLYNKDGSVTFTSTKDYNSGVSYYINPATKDDDIIDISDTRGEGFMGYDNGTKDMSAYDYVRVKVTSENEMNCRTYNGNDQLRSAGFPGSSSSETYEGGWIHTDDEVWEAESTFTAGNTVKAAYKTRTVFIPISMLMGKGMNPENLTAIAFCPQSSGAEVTIHRIDFVKVKYDKLVTGIDVKAAKTEIAPGKTTTVTAAVTPADATRQIVKWTSSNEDVATVNFAGTVVAKKGAEGKVTITATSTDGSKVTGSVDITVKEPSEEPTVIKSHNVDLTKVVGKTNPGAGDSIAATQTAASIDFMTGGSMLYVDMSEYLATNDLDLSDYDQIKVTYQLKNQDGSDASEYTTAPSWGNFALVTKNDLNGYTNPGVLAGTIGNKIADTAVFDLSKADAAGLGTAAGFNFQLPAMDADKYISITGITLYKDNNAYVDLTKVVGKTNPGAGDSIAATQTAAGIDFMVGGSMLYVDMSEYLVANDLDLSDYAEVQVTYQLKNQDGSDASEYTTAPSWGNFALVTKNDLNGYTNPGVLAGTIGNKIADTAVFDLSKADAAGLGTAAGFNFQLPAMDADKYLSITKIVLVSK